MKRAHSSPWGKVEQQPLFFEEKLNAKLRTRVAYSACKKRWVLVDEGRSYPDQNARVIRIL